MRRVLALLSLTIVVSCAAPAPPPPVSVPEEPVAPAPAAPVEERVIRGVRVTATSLNVRASASTEADVITQVRRGTALDVLSENESWVKVRLADGSTGWVAARFVSGGGETKQASARKKSGGCPADSDYAFTETPMPSFSDRGAHGIVVVEANVNASGNVTKTRVVSNGTGDETLAFLAEKEIKAAKFSPPIRNCVPRAFIFTYKRAF
ncbi:MAG TPA: TonB family protein [Thermoanaerobaculia bacterium]|jgi:TonB family protein